MLTDGRLAEIDAALAGELWATPAAWQQRAAKDLRTEVDRLRRWNVEYKNGREANAREWAKLAVRLADAEAAFDQQRDEMRQHVSGASLRGARQHSEIKRLRAHLSVAEAVCEGVCKVWYGGGPYSHGLHASIDKYIRTWQTLCEQQNVRKGGQEPAQQDDADETPPGRGQGDSGA